MNYYYKINLLKKLNDEDNIMTLTLIPMCLHKIFVKGFSCLELQLNLSLSQLWRDERQGTEQTGGRANPHRKAKTTLWIQTEGLIVVRQQW